MSKRGGSISHKLVLAFNVLSLFLIIFYILVNNTDLRVFYLLLGFSPAVAAVAINAGISKKTNEAYAYFSIPFITTTLFIVLGSLSLNTLTKRMDLETLTVINFLYTFFFAFFYYMAAASLEKEKKEKEKRKKKRLSQEDNKVSHKNQEKSDDKSHKEDKEEQKEEPKHIVHKIHVPHYIPVKIDEKERPKLNPFIHELKKEFNIINIDSESIINSLRELAKGNNEIDIHLILEKLEKNKVFFSSNTGEKYHKPLCIVMNHISHDKILAFKSEQEAEMQGFKPCRVCMPK